MSIHYLKSTFYPAIRSVKYSGVRLCMRLRETADILATWSLKLYMAVWLQLARAAYFTPITTLHMYTSYSVHFQIGFVISFLPQLLFAGRKLFRKWLGAR